MTRTALTILAATLVLGGMGEANAATITETYDFTASDFTPSGSPVNPWTGSFTITFDPTKASSGALNAFSSNLPAGYGTFTFLYGGPGDPALDVGNHCSAVDCGVGSGSDEAVLNIFPVSASGVFTFNEAIVGSTTNVSDLFESFTGTVSPTPLPAALSLFATGLGALGLFGWRRKRKAQAAAA